MNKNKMILSSVIFTLSLGLLTSCNVTEDDGPGWEPRTVDITVDVTANKPTLKHLGPNFGKDDSALNSDSTVGIIENLTGYTTEYSQLPASDALTSLNTLLGVDKAQYTTVKVTRDQFRSLVVKGAFLKLDEGIEKYCPNMKEVIGDDSWEVVKYYDSIYGIPEKASSDNVDNVIVFRQDYLDRYDIEMPTTADEFKTVLSTLKEKYGKNDATFYPLTGDKTNILVKSIAPAFGIYSEFQENEKGELTNYFNLSETKNYAEYMIDLVNDGLIDNTMGTNDKATAISKFARGNSAAVVCSWWDIPSIVSSLDANKQIGAEIGYLKSLKNSDGVLKTFRSSGYSYVTVIPNYMGSKAAYALDWMDKKLQEDTFREIVIGEEGVHYTKNSKGEYWPITPAFNDKDQASYYLTGSNEKMYPIYWQARVRKNDEMYKCWSYLMDNVENEGVINPMNYAPALRKYAETRYDSEQYAQDQLVVVIFGEKSTAKLSNYVSSYLSKLTQDAYDEVNNWYQGFKKK